MSVVHVVLFEPEIAGNTGNIIRMCSNTGARLHLIEPLGFELDDARLRRAGLDYREYADVRTHPSLAECRRFLNGTPFYAFSARAETSIFDTRIDSGAALLFGPESTGLDRARIDEAVIATWVTIPMRPGSRSLNLSNAAAVATYEVLRQLSFPLS